MKANAKLFDPTAAGVEFLRSELDTGLTLSKIALDSNHLEKSNRNRFNARKAYNAILHFAPKINLTEKEIKEIESKLGVLKSNLRELGEEI